MVTQHKIARVKLGPLPPRHIINDFETAKELLGKDAFAGRVPSKHMPDLIFSDPDTPEGIIFNMGQSWQNQRRFCFRALRDLGFGKRSLESIIEMEINELIETFANVKDDDVKIGADFNVPIINVLWNLMAGERLVKDKGGAAKMDMVNFLAADGINSIWLVLPVPILKFFPNFTGYKKIKHGFETVRKEMLETVNRHLASLDPSNPRDFIDVYLKAMQSCENKKYNINNLVACVRDFFMAGAETISNTLKWSLLFLTLHQDHQDKCRSEIRALLGDEPPNLSHLKDLPFTMAMLTEVQRMACVIPASNRAMTQDYNHNGYFFPKGALLLENLCFMMKDPAHFPDPEVFNPNRFLDVDGKFVRNERMVSFGIGQRICMGESLARQELFMFFGSLVQRLKFLPPTSHSMPDQEDFKVNFTRVPADFYVRIETVHA